jgi:hypothetical protein
VATRPSDKLVPVELPAGDASHDTSGHRDESSSCRVDREIVQLARPQPHLLSHACAGFDVPDADEPASMAGDEEPVSRQEGEVVHLTVADPKRLQLGARAGIPVSAKRQSGERAGFRARRWVVERTHSWLNRFRRVLVRWEKRADTYLAMLHFACSLVTWQAAGLVTRRGLAK